MRFDFTNNTDWESLFPVAGRWQKLLYVAYSSRAQGPNISLNLTFLNNNRRQYGKYCAKHGVHMHLTAPYFAQHNKVLEHGNQIVVGITRSMLTEKGLPRDFLGRGSHHCNLHPQSCSNPKCYRHDIVWSVAQEEVNNALFSHIPLCGTHQNILVL